MFECPARGVQRVVARMRPIAADVTKSKLGGSVPSRGRTVPCDFNHLIFDCGTVCRCASFVDFTLPSRTNELHYFHEQDLRYILQQFPGQMGIVAGYSKDPDRENNVCQLVRDGVVKSTNATFETRTLLA